MLNLSADLEVYFDPTEAAAATHERFLRRVIMGAGCWEWSGAHDTRGYGQMRTTQDMAHGIVGRNRQAHRISYELFNGPIPDGMYVCHKCDNPGCVNPSHLFLGTHQENMRDMVAKRRHPYGERVYGAKMTEEMARTALAEMARGVSQRELSKRLGVSQQTLSHLKCGDSWKYLERGKDA